MTLDLAAFVAPAILLTIGVIQTALHVRRFSAPGKRVGVILASMATLLQFLLASLVSYWAALLLIPQIWQRPYLAIIPLGLCLGFASIVILQAVAKKSLPKGNIYFQSMVPVFSQEHRKVIALHEAGHLLLHCSIPTDHLPERLMARITNGISGIAGYVQTFPSSRNLIFPSKEYLEWECLMLLAGDLATQALVGKRYTGASADMDAWYQAATSLLANGLTPFPWTSSRSDEGASIRWVSYQSLLAEHRAVLQDFILANRALIFKTADLLQAAGALSRTQCVLLIKQARRGDRLPRLTAADVNFKGWRKIK